jgi:hypothetical protein
MANDLKPSVIKILMDAGYDPKFVFRYPWFMIWILMFVVGLPLLSAFHIVSSDFCAGAYLAIIPTTMMLQKLLFLKISRTK